MKIKIQKKAKGLKTGQLYLYGIPYINPWQLFLNIMISANIKIDEYPFLKIKYPVSRENSIAKIPNRKLIKKAIVVGVIFMPGKRDNI